MDCIIVTQRTPHAPASVLLDLLAPPTWFATVTYGAAIYRDLSAVDTDCRFIFTLQCPIPVFRDVLCRLFSFMYIFVWWYKNPTNSPSRSLQVNMKLLLSFLATAALANAHCTFSFLFFGTSTERVVFSHDAICLEQWCKRFLKESWRRITRSCA
jgi:hypothetical protein